MIRAFAAVVTVFFLMVGPCLAQQTGSEVAPEIKGLLKTHEEAFRNKDMQGIMDLYAPGPETVLLGTGPGERWTGEEEIKDAYMHFFENFDTSESKLTWLSADSRGDVAWLSAMVRYTYYLKNEKTEFGINLSAVLEKTDGKWRFVALHFSNLAAE